MAIFYSDAQFDMMEQLKGKREIRYWTKHFTGKAFRTADLLRRHGWVKVKFGMDRTKPGVEREYIVVTATKKLLGKAKR